MGDKPCSECKWFRSNLPGLVVPGDHCANRNSIFIYAVSSRNSLSGCGPSGRYWEPKEDKGND